MFQLFISCFLYGGPILSLAIVVYYIFRFKAQIANLEMKILADSLRLRNSIKEQITGGFDFRARALSEKQDGKSTKQNKR